MGEPKAKMTVEEYLALTDGSQELDERLEWVNGEMYAMAGGTPVHAAVGTNVTGALWNALRGKPCRATNGDQRIALDETGAYLYPDVTVVCGPYKLAADGLSITNPSVIVEVLSPSTERFDRGGKFEHYRRLKSLMDFVLIDPIQRTVSQYSRHAEGWFLRDIESGMLKLIGGDVEIAFEDIFADLDNVTAQAANP